eukprot:scaffold6363_cov25-Tisochrysis_lutea.AAC.2
MQRVRRCGDRRSPELREPVEVVGGLDASLDHLRQHVPAVDIESDQCSERRAIELRQRTLAHEPDDVVELARARLLVLFESREPTCAQRRLSLERPPNLVNCQDGHAGPIEHPGRALLAAVVRIGGARDACDSRLHGSFHLQHPLLDHAIGRMRVDRRNEGDHLTLDGAHGADDLVLVKLERVDALEALLEVWLHAQGVLGLGQDLKQLVVGQEEETREGKPLCLEVVVEALLDELKQAVGLNEGRVHALLRCRKQHVGSRRCGLHGLAPHPVHLRGRADAVGVRAARARGGTGRKERACGGTGRRGAPA